jgi:hypothetical protein
MKHLNADDLGYLCGTFTSSHGNGTVTDEILIDGISYSRYTNGFWTSGQRQGSSLHEISYRACFKPQLPSFFIRHLTAQEDRVYDPFCGRGTTVIEAALLRRRVAGNDCNPLSSILARPRLNPPSVTEVRERLTEIPRQTHEQAGIELAMFFHSRTESEILALRAHLRERIRSGKIDAIDEWIRMVATNRLTGHSRGFFSVYTLPPNQAVTPARQRLINRKLMQEPQYRDTHEIILAKTRSLLRKCSQEDHESLRNAAVDALFTTRDARSTPEIRDDSVALVVTSPPFLDTVQYRDDNWLRCWFNDIPADAIGKQITSVRSIGEWSAIMGDVFLELYRITRPGGCVAFEVGEVRKGSIKLDEHVVPLGVSAGFRCNGIIVNLQHFTKTANIWGIRNNSGGTNTNRIVLFRKG